MKAKEYYGKYHLAALDHTPTAIQLQMMYDFQSEFRDICHQRKAVTTPARNGIIRELNEKWNAVAALFTSKDQKSVLEHDGFINRMLKGNTDLARSIKDTSARLPSGSVDARVAYLFRKALLDF